MNAFDGKPETTEQLVVSTAKTLVEVSNELEKDFPTEALSSDISRGFALTSVKAQYIKERLNQVFTPMGWSLDGAFEYDDAPAAQGGVVFHGFLELDLNFIGIPAIKKFKAIGYSEKKKNRGDTLKSAMTDALSKAASNLGVANSVFKGLIAPPKAGKSTSPAKSSKEETSKPASFKGKSRSTLTSRSNR